MSDTPTPGPTPDALELAALMCSRVCHDLINPVGAIVNGLEVFDSSNKDDDKEFALDLIRKSAKSTSARLQFCRIAYGAAGHRHAVAKFTHQRLGCMGQRFQPRQSEKAARSLDGMDQPENVIENFRVVRILLEPHQLVIDRVETLVGFSQKFPKQIVHQTQAFTLPARDTHLPELAQSRRKAFNIG